MCGIFGIINHSKTFITRGETLVKQMFLGSTLRGTDAYGMVLVNQKGEMDWFKMAGTSLNGFFTDDKEGRPRFTKMETDKGFIICHNRHATVGDKGSVKYAHPHIVEDILGLVHNGTLTYWPDKYSKNFTDESDSQGLARLISTIGIEATLKEVRGAFVIAYYDVIDQTLNIVRNDERPLGLVHTKDFSVFASEPLMAQWVLERNDTKVLNIENVETEKLYTWKIGEFKPTTKDVEFAKVHHYGRRWQGYGYGYDDEETTVVSRPSNIIPITHKPHVKIAAGGAVSTYEGYKVGDSVEFTIGGWSQVPGQKFCSVWGYLLGDDSQLAVVRGNIACDISILDSMETNLTGVITSMNSRPHKDEIFIQVKDIEQAKAPEEKATSSTEGEKVGTVAPQLPVPFRLNAATHGMCDECGAVVPLEHLSKMKDYVWSEKNREMELISRDICSTCCDTMSYIKNAMC